jgi:hypothetical protein
VSKESDLLQAAKELAASAETWADLSNALFAPDDGIVAKAYRTREERTAFAQTDESRQISQLVGDAMTRTGLIEGATPKKGQMP